MKVFISWSGERSKRVAELLDDWVQCVLQAVSPWMSSKDIDRGSLWFTEITDQLASTSVGIVCLTKENRVKPWILFESGALAKGLSSSRVCTFLIDLVPTDLENPLAQFNHTTPDRDGLWSLVRTINLSLKDGQLKESVLSRVFDTYWPQFEQKFGEILKSTPEVEKIEKRKDNDIMLDVLSTVRNLDRRIRNIEITERESSFVNERRHVFGSAREVRTYIRMLLKQDKSIDQIMDSLIDKGLPPRLAKKEISNVMDEIREDVPPGEDRAAQ